MKDLKIYDCSNKKFTSTTVLGEYDNLKITVSHMLTAAQNSLKFIKNNFNVDEKPYSVAIVVLNLIQMRLYNQNVGRPAKEQFKCLVDVFHEIADLNSRSEKAKQENEMIANELKMIIEFYYRGDKND